MPFECQIKNNLTNIIELNKIIAVVRTINKQKAVDISKALIDGGIKVIEITMSFDDAHKAIETIAEDKNIHVAAGSVITSRQAEQAINCGSKIIISPVLEMNVIKTCKAKNIPVITGAATPNEIYNAWKVGICISKVFPAKSLGGPQFIKDILTPMPFLKLFATGGISLNSFIDYLKAGAVAVGIGNDFYNNFLSYNEITQKAVLANQKLNDFLN